MGAANEALRVGGMDGVEGGPADLEDGVDAVVVDVGGGEEGAAGVARRRQGGRLRPRRRTGGLAGMPITRSAEPMLGKAAVNSISMRGPVTGAELRPDPPLPGGCRGVA